MSPSTGPVSHPSFTMPPPPAPAGGIGLTVIRFDERAEGKPVSFGDLVPGDTFAVITQQGQFVPFNGHVYNQVETDGSVVPAVVRAQREPDFTMRPSESIWRWDDDPLQHLPGNWETSRGDFDADRVGGEQARVLEDHLRVIAAEQAQADIEDEPFRNAGIVMRFTLLDLALQERGVIGEVEYEKPVPPADGVNARGFHFQTSVEAWTIIGQIYEECLVELMLEGEGAFSRFKHEGVLPVEDLLAIAHAVAARLSTRTGLYQSLGLTPEQTGKLLKIVPYDGALYLYAGPLAGGASLELIQQIVDFLNGVIGELGRRGSYLLVSFESAVLTPTAS